MLVLSKNDGTIPHIVCSQVLASESYEMESSLNIATGS